MALNWEIVANAVLSVLKGSLPYAKVELIASVDDYLNNATAQALFDNKDVLVLLAPIADGDTEDAEPMISYRFRKRFMMEISVVSKVDPTQKVRMFGKGAKKGIFEARGDVVTALEHKNLGGLVDNKAGTNFETGWAKVDNDNRSITAYKTIYTVVKTES